jgi:hypothetical protein
MVVRDLPTPPLLPLTSTIGEFIQVHPHESQIADERGRHCKLRMSGRIHFFKIYTMNLHKESNSVM